MFRIEPAEPSLRERHGSDVAGVLRLGPDRMAFTEPPQATELGVPWTKADPSQTIRDLSSWTNRIPALFGRASEIADLLAWAEGDPPVSLRFLVGPLSSGKSRLAGELCEILRTKGWAAGIVDPRILQTIVLRRAGTLVVIDDAADSRTEVEEILEDLAVVSPDRRIRVLVIGRERATSWDAAVRRAVLEARVAGPPLSLDHLRGDTVRPCLRPCCEEMACVFNVSPVFLRATQEERFVTVGYGIRAAVMAAIALVADSYPEEFRKAVPPIAARTDVADLAYELASYAATISGTLSRKTLGRMVRHGHLGPRMTEQLLSRACWLEPTHSQTDPALHAPPPRIPAAAFMVAVKARYPDVLSALSWVGVSEAPREALVRLAVLAYICTGELGLSSACVLGPLSDAVRGRTKRYLMLDRWFTRFEVMDPLTSLAVRAAKVAISFETDQAKLLRKWSRTGALLTEQGSRVKAREAGRKCVEILKGLSRSEPTWRNSELGSDLATLADALGTKDRPGAYILVRESLAIFKPLAEKEIEGWGEHWAGIVDMLAQWQEDDGDLDGAAASIESTLPTRRLLVEFHGADSLSGTLLLETLERLWSFMHDENLCLASWIREPRSAKEDRAFAHLKELVALAHRRLPDESGHRDSMLAHHLIDAAEEYRVRDLRAEAIACLREGLELSTARWAGIDNMKGVLESWRNELGKWERGEDLVFEEQIKREFAEEQAYLAEIRARREAEGGEGTEGERG